MRNGKGAGVALEEQPDVLYVTETVVYLREVYAPQGVVTSVS